MFSLLASRSCVAIQRRAGVVVLPGRAFRVWSRVEFEWERELRFSGEWLHQPQVQHACTCSIRLFIVVVLDSGGHSACKRIKSSSSFPITR